MSKKSITKKSKVDAPKGIKKKSLPKGVTPEPQDDEQMHLKHIAHSPALVDVYLPVSDDKGGLLKDKRLEKKVVGFIERYNQKESDEIDNLEAVLDKLRAIYKVYSQKINLTGSISNGILTKCRTRQGMLLILEKRLTKLSSKQWIDHFAKTYGRKHLRSAQDYMALARVPNIIRYAFYGKERLMAITRAIKVLDITDSDPVAAFLDKYKISFDPESSNPEESLAELKIKIDAAIAVTTIKKIEQKNNLQLKVREDLIEKLIGLGISVEKGLIEDLVIVKNAKGNVNKHLENVYIAGGQGNPIVVSTKKVQGFPKLVESFKTTVEYIRDNSSLVEQIDRGKIEELEQSISELKTLIDNPNNN